MELVTKQYRVSVPGRECRKCVSYKRPYCDITGTYTWEKNFCEDWARKELKEVKEEVNMGCDPWVEAEAAAKKQEKVVVKVTAPSEQVVVEPVKPEPVKSESVKTKKWSRKNGK